MALFLLADAITPGPFSYFELSFMSSGGATLALAAMGQTFVVLTGGFDLSAGAVISLVNVTLASHMDPMAMDASVVLWTLVGVAVGSAVGAFNGFFIAVLRLQPIVVTLSTMFILQGVTLLVMDKPGGTTVGYRVPDGTASPQLPISSGRMKPSTRYSQIAAANAHATCVPIPRALARRNVRSHHSRIEVVRKNPAMSHQPPR